MINPVDDAVVYAFDVLKIYIGLVQMVSLFAPVFLIRPLIDSRPVPVR